MKFIVVRLLTNSPDPDTGRRASATEVLGDAIEEASYFEELGFDGYGIGEHHIDDAEASSPRGHPRLPRCLDEADPTLHRRHGAVAARPGPGRRGLRHRRRACPAVEST